MNDKLAYGRLIKKINDAIERYANNSLRESGLTMVQVRVLLSLNQMDEKTCSFKELEQIMGVAQSTCAGIINRLALKQFVDCFVDANDKRMKLVQITSKGEQCCADTMQNIKAMEERIARGLSAEEQELFHSLLLRVYENVK